MKNNELNVAVTSFQSTLLIILIQLKITPEPTRWSFKNFTNISSQTLIKARSCQLVWQDVQIWLLFPSTYLQNFIELNQAFSYVKEVLLCIDLKSQKLQI